MNCEDRSGFLFAHACDRVASISCEACQKHVCPQHLRGEGGRPLCVACARKEAAEPKAENAERRQGMAHADPYLYGAYYGYSMYDADDRSAFSSRRSSTFRSSSHRSHENDFDGT